MLLAELLIALGVGSLLLLALFSFFAFSGRSFAALTNYSELDARSRRALDLLSRDIRRSDKLAAYASNRIELVGFGSNVVYQHIPADRIFVRTVGADTTTLLTGVDSFKFAVFQRTPVGGAYENFPAAGGAVDAKVVQVDWICSRRVIGTRTNTESVQSAKIVLRTK